MPRRTRYIIGLAIVVISAAIAFVLSSNLLVSVGTATFTPGERNLNQLNITAPYGWYCISYEKMMTVPESTELHVGGSGMSRCPLFGPDSMMANFYPDSGTTQVPLDQPTLVYQRPDKGLEIYVLITKDASKYDYLDEN